MFAVYGKHIRVVKELLLAGAETTTKSKVLVSLFPECD